ncbi:hypothetical protein [Croceicoccus sp. BE223]|uniref:hypothetical protein n=1 Tax=Croceicoccus sp. BE223 TaxID=2817716 RepID=UPI0028664991|nr:hypothetical protein [Croceicoccus sp. BE223]MDR7103201.1 hypothetical protein [Croceicoccus sp. BE223]
MKKLVLVAAMAALSACSQPAEQAPAAQATDTAQAAPAATETAAASMAVDGKPDTGNFQMSGPDGASFKLTMNGDGTLVTDVDGTTTNGTWTKTEPATYCMTMEGEAEAKCYVDVMDGTTWRSTNSADPKDTWTVVRIN